MKFIVIPVVALLMLLLWNLLDKLEKPISDN